MVDEDVTGIMEMKSQLSVTQKTLTQSQLQSIMDWETTPVGVDILMATANTILLQIVCN